MGVLGGCWLDVLLLFLFFGLRSRHQAVSAQIGLGKAAQDGRRAEQGRRGEAGTGQSSWLRVWAGHRLGLLLLRLYSWRVACFLHRLSCLYRVCCSQR
ncbi:hypothetical protein BCR37DRAFT_381497 [Protomyces lactucae-debilis]|uniref:Secreted protein n=1 Tax=Protomyces lactucae-debilis TaxID=2754530 RepID=A0A1Y2F843_PROLT|nr:uncharacterized protein BCR37DRAFT_381497 [Protomyces lactucae-debilis]ORY80043.1 hypothetical protein BCR37DRAFT_381497 [Protomyces lactucae-debilis]